MLIAKPLTLQEATEFVARLHRHNLPVYRDKFRIGAENDGILCGVAQVGRPIARMLDDGRTLEVVRLCTDGTPNACSFLYARAARIAELLGYSRIVTYITATENGGSLLAAGFVKTADVKWKSWNNDKRTGRKDALPVDKQRYERQLRP